MISHHYVINENLFLGYFPSALGGRRRRVQESQPGREPGLPHGHPEGPAFSGGGRVLRRGKGGGGRRRGGRGGRTTPFEIHHVFFNGAGEVFSSFCLEDHQRMASCSSSLQVRIGPRRSLLHCKFLIARRRRGASGAARQRRRRRRTKGARRTAEE